MTQTALITGASKGIGYELAKLFAGDGVDLVLVARNESQLQQVKEEIAGEFGVKIWLFPLDLGPPDAAQHLYEQLNNEGLRIDYLVNNAGFGLLGAFTETSWEKEAQMISLNITALTRLTKLFLPQLIDKGKGRILNVASLAAFQPGPLMAVYYASKSYVLSFSEALDEELKGTGITVTTLCPGPVKTGFQENAEMGNVRLFNLPIVKEAGEVARYGYQKMKKGKRIVIPGFLLRLNVFLLRFLPRKWVTASVKRVHE